jgi:enamine deaminase RidA (YjgF/YER057c/UK114 family)
MTPDIQRLHVATRYSEAAVFNGVVYLAGMVPECEATDIRSQTTDVLQLPVFTNFTILKRPLNASDSATMSRIVGLSQYIMADEFWMAQVETVG